MGEDELQRCEAQELFFVALLPAPERPPSTLCGSSTIRTGRVARTRSIGRSPPVFSLSL